MNHPLTQTDVDAVFAKPKKQDAGAGRKVPVFDFGRQDRVAKSQIRTIHGLHEVFARNLSASLSAYLRSYLTVNAISVEQLSYGEFTEGLPQPTSLVAVNLKPCDGSAVIEMNPQLVFTMLEILLGGKARESAPARREITDIEQSLVEVLYRIVLHDLREAWKPVAPIEFRIEALATEPQALRVVAPGEPVVAIGFEIRLGEIAGTMSLAFPSSFIRTIGQKFDREPGQRKAEASEPDQQRLLGLVRRSTVELEAQIEGLKLKVRDLLEIEEGDVLQLDYPVGQPVDCTINGTKKYRGRLAGSRTKKAFVIEEMPEV
jgi:flagellar motor switch protein FliM